jgi:hypothetical protein
MCVTEAKSHLMLSFLGVLLALFIPCAFLIILRAILAISSFFWPPRDGVHEDENGTVLGQLRANSHEPNPFKLMREIWAGTFPIGLPENGGVPEHEEEDNLQNGWRNSWRSIKRGFRSTDRKLFWKVVLAILILLGFYVGAVIGSIYSAKILTDNIVLSKSQSAGVWVPDRSSPGARFGQRAQIGYKKQMHAWNYVKECYGTNSNDKPGCSTFYQQVIKHSTEPNVNCPFNGDACLQGSKSAYKVTTGMQDSNVLGINAPADKRFHFERSITCAPLHMDSRYVRSTGDEYPGMWEYYYGGYHSDAETNNQTFSNTGDWSLMGDWQPDYSIS